MPHKDFANPRLRQLAADLSLANRLAEAGRADLNAELKRRVREDLERAMREVGQLSEEQASGGAGRAIEQGRRPMSTDTSLRCNQRLLA